MELELPRKFPRLTFNINLHFNLSRFYIFVTAITWEMVARRTNEVKTQLRNVFCGCYGNPILGRNRARLLRFQFKLEQLNFHVEIFNFRVADVEAADGCLGVHGAVFREADAYAIKVD